MYFGHGFKATSTILSDNKISRYSQIECYSREEDTLTSMLRQHTVIARACDYFQSGQDWLLMTIPRVHIASFEALLLITYINCIRRFLCTKIFVPNIYDFWVTYSKWKTVVSSWYGETLYQTIAISLQQNHLMWRGLISLKRDLQDL